MSAIESISNLLTYVRHVMVMNFNKICIENKCLF